MTALAVVLLFALALDVLIRRNHALTRDAARRRRRHGREVAGCAGS